MKTKFSMLLISVGMLFASFTCTNAQEWSWSEKYLSIAREGISATALDDSIFFSMGRLYSTAFVHTIDIYEVDEGVWTSYESQSNARWNTVSVSCNGMVFIAGGNNWPQGANFADVDIYSKATGEWTIEYLSIARSLIGATCHMNKVFFGGGMFWGTNVAIYDVIDIYDTETNTWDTLSLTVPKAAVGVVAAGGKVFFAGGGTALGVGTDVVEIYDIETGDWTYDTLSQARSFPACVAYGNKVYFAGGALANAFSSVVIDVYNLDTESWEDTLTLSYPRIVRALKVKDALVFAGETDFISGSGAWGAANGIIDVYYPETGEWDYSVPDLNPARIMYGCAAYDDKAYFGGGYPGGSYVSDIVSILKYQSFHCLPDGITFTTQEEIDNFQTNYPYCTEIEGDVEINGDEIQNLNGLDTVTAIGGDLKINSNDALTSLSGLDSITSIGGELRIVFNTSLTSLSGLENIEAATITDLSIFLNSNLSYCNVWSICQYLNTPNGTIEIHDNDPGCNNFDEVWDACYNSVAKMNPGSQGNFSILPNPLQSTSLITYTLNQNSPVTLKILDLSGREMLILVDDFQHRGEQQIIFNTSNMQAGIYFCVLETIEGIQTRKIVKL